MSSAWPFSADGIHCRRQICSMKGAGGVIYTAGGIMTSSKSVPHTYIRKPETRITEQGEIRQKPGLEPGTF